jgi:hypothetical protein
MTDDELLAELGEAVRAAAEVPASFRDAGRAAFAWRTVDEELALLVDDTVVLAGSRSDATLRAMTFACAALIVELEVTQDALLGQLVPPQPGTVDIQTATGRAQTVTADELGWFTISPPPADLFRLRVTTGSGEAVVTAWARITPP